ncbi:putative diguanylate cyclase [Meiothermus taiwanensis WR-220]|uniref:Diguanylate cyclase n=2 Tax=Meiothermus taiwanensis TaxID=172827 RepID=A0ABN5M3Q7_9DEIN|nr:diguanylate cyclase [Meiothermus taiwanensis]AWR87904.1 putative diguanylate cyclase [Meiothermus taiwanensis WR-220]KIQ53667.1 diguanylate cyclase [Meiothermus taiwanensis]
MTVFGGGALALTQLLVGTDTARWTALAYLGATPILLSLTQRYPQPALIAHLGATLGLLVWAVQQPEAVVPGWNHEVMLYAVATLATLGLTALALFGGPWVMLGSLIGLVALLPHPESGPYWVVWPLWALGGLVGVALFQAVRNLEATQQELSQVALFDRQTGLSTRLALEVDYERYQALASRSDQPLLFSYWLLPEAGQNLQLLQELGQIMREALRQGDGLYRMDDHLFCGLHIGLVSGHELTERLSQRFANARVVWVACNGLTLEEALRQAQELLYRSHRRPQQSLTGMPRA